MSESVCFLCGAECDEDAWCFGCRHLICDAHLESPLGGHDPKEHDGGDDEED